jgi:hypothetical protein
MENSGKIYNPKHVGDLQNSRLFAFTTKKDNPRWDIEIHLLGDLGQILVMYMGDNYNDGILTIYGADEKKYNEVLELFKMVDRQNFHSIFDVGYFLTDCGILQIEYRSPSIYFNWRTS